MAVRKIEIQWSSKELFSSVREVNEAELLEWLGNPEPDRVSGLDVLRFIQSGDPGKDFDLTAMSEGTSWHDRDDPVAEGVVLL